MATKLISPITRESSELVNDRNILIRLNDDQTISLKLKGMKSGSVTIGIKELWEQLNGEEEEVPVKKKSKAVLNNNDKDEPMISIHRLRSLNAVTHSDLAVTIKLDEILSDILKGKR